MLIQFDSPVALSSFGCLINCGNKTKMRLLALNARKIIYFILWRYNVLRNILNMNHQRCGLWRQSKFYFRF